jgi:predicted ribosome quality control (RQC) complex YloA/Tae2 family protein
VIVDSSGHLGTSTSSARFKENIQPMEKASEAILSLQPVTFRYKKGLDPKGIPQFGLIAEEVEKVNPDLVASDDQGKPYSVRYEAVNAMLLNEFLKEHRKVIDANQRIGSLEAKVSKLKSALKEQAAQIQKVIAQSQLSQSSARVTVNAQ